MNVLILNCSPKPIELSTTISHINYLIKMIPEHDYDFVPIARDINKIEKDNSLFESILNKIQNCDVIIWAFPVYVYSIPAQLKKFIELIFQNKEQNTFTNKYATSTVISSNVFEYPASKYIHAISEELGMQFCPGFCYSTLVDKELFVPKKATSFIEYYRYFFDKASKKTPLMRKFKNLEPQNNVFHYTDKINCNNKLKSKKIVLITDHTPNSSLASMVNCLVNFCNFEIEIINLHNNHIKYYCSSCLKCQPLGYCVLKDDLNNIYENKLQEADAIVYAITSMNRHTSSVWKKFIDRSFSYIQRPLLENKYFLALLQTDSSDNSFLSEFVEIYSSCRNFNYLGSIMNDQNDQNIIKTNISSLVKDLEYFLEKDITLPASSYSRQYHYSLREVLYMVPHGKLSTFKYLKKRGLMKFPNSRLNSFIRHHFLSALFSIPFMKKQITKRIWYAQHAPYAKFLKKK